MKPILITSPDTWAWAGTVNAALAASTHAAVLEVNLMSKLLQKKVREGKEGLRLEASRRRKVLGENIGSDTQVLVQPLEPRWQFGLGELLDHLAVLHHQEAVCQRCGE